MSAVERAANILQCRLSWPQAEACARDLDRAGLFATDRFAAEKAAVLQAALEWRRAGLLRGGLEHNLRRHLDAWINAELDAELDKRLEAKDAQ